MSVQKNSYIVFGIKFDYVEFKKLVNCKDSDSAFEVCEPYYDNAFKTDDWQDKELNILFDGMDGKYVIVGKFLAKSENYGTLPSIDLDGLQTPKKKNVAEKIEELLGFKVSEKDIKLFTHTHYR